MYVNLLFLAVVCMALMLSVTLAVAGLYFHKRNRRMSLILFALAVVMMALGLVLANGLMAFFGELTVGTGG